MKHVIIIGLIATLIASLANAQEKKAASFKTTLSSGVTLTDGNSETLQANGSLVTEGEKEGLGSVRAGISGNYGESTVEEKKDTTVANAKAFANVKKTLTPKTFGSIDASILNDDVADINYRATLGPGLGAYLVKNAKTALSVEAGPSYVWEKVAGVADDYLALRFGETFSQTLSPTAKIWESVEYLPRASDFGDYLLNAEIGAEAAMTTRLSLRLVLQDKYDSTPGAGLEENDLTLIAGVSIRL